MNAARAHPSPGRPSHSGQSPLVSVRLRPYVPHALFAPTGRLTAVFPSSLGLLEGKTLPEVEKKVKLVRSLLVVSLDRAAHVSLGSQRGRRPSLSLVPHR